LVAYVVAARASLSLRSWRSRAFCLINLLWLVPLLARDSPSLGALAGRVLTYLAAVSACYVALSWASTRGGRQHWFAFSVPILFLVGVRWLSNPSSIANHVLVPYSPAGITAAFVGLSYMAFRLSFLVLEVRNSIVPKPTFAEYMSFAFFAPTLVVGPINSYSLHRSSLLAEEPAARPWRAAFRVVVGATKYVFLGSLFDQLSYAGLLGDGHLHGVFDVCVAAVSYYLYLYCNFSGFCDMAIGTAGLVGIRVSENFDCPLAARSVQDFWARWHITLSNYMRNVVFTPVTKWLVGRLGPQRLNEAIAAAILLVFLLVGVWHGAGARYIAFGLAHGVALVVNHYYGIWLKRVLGRERFRAYSHSRLVRAAATVATFAYISATFFLFANSGPQMLEILGSLTSSA
jgi:D-alanyl-lipoteichoic acid acyltransferase DltB (MBOAT superfamily)